MNSLINLLAQKTKLKQTYITNILKLMDEGATIPFIARYRKEMTGGASDEVLREFEGVYLSVKKLLERKAEIERLIQERGVLTDAIKKSITFADSLRVLEDIYRPYKEKKSSRAATAIANGLKPLAYTLQSAKLSLGDFKAQAKMFVKGRMPSKVHRTSWQNVMQISHVSVKPYATLCCVLVPSKPRKPKGLMREGCILISSNILRK